MDAIKRTIVFLVLAVVVGFLVVFITPGENTVNEDDELIVGVGEDITGLLMEQVMLRYRADGHNSVSSVSGGDTSVEMDSYLFVD